MHWLRRRSPQSSLSRRCSDPFYLHCPPGSPQLVQSPPASSDHQYNCSEPRFERQNCMCKIKKQKQKVTFGISPQGSTPPQLQCMGTSGLVTVAVALQAAVSTPQHPRQLSTPTHISHLSSLVVIIKSHISFLCHHQMNCFQSCQ